MKRSSTQGGSGEGAAGGEILQNKKRYKTETKNQPPSQPVIGTVATRTRHQQKTKASSWNKPIPILINILVYADPESLRMLCLVSKQFLDIISNSPAMKNHRVLPLLQISPSNDQEDPARTKRLIHQLHQHRAKLQQCCAIKVTRLSKFRWIDPDRSTWTICGEVNHLFTYCMQSWGLYGVEELDMSSAAQDGSSDDSLLFAFTRILPNLREIDLSNTDTFSATLEKVIKACSRLEKITWHNIPESSEMEIDGFDLRHATNLKEMYMDDAEFYCPINFDFHYDLDATIFLFPKCGSNKLERVSIRNATYGNGVYERIAVSQKALMKFVRKSPSLRWFRSNLTADNIAMLRLERPEIECVN